MYLRVFRSNDFASVCAAKTRQLLNGRITQLFQMEASFLSTTLYLYVCVCVCVCEHGTAWHFTVSTIESGEVAMTSAAKNSQYEELLFVFSIVDQSVDSHGITIRIVIVFLCQQLRVFVIVIAVLSLVIDQP